MTKDILILAVETSCDETSVSVIKMAEIFYQIQF